MKRFCSAQMMTSVCDSLSDGHWYSFLNTIPQTGWVGIIALPLFLLSLLRSLSYLSFTSLIGDAALLLAFITVFVIGFRLGISLPLFLSRLSFYFSPSLYFSLASLPFFYPSPVLYFSLASPFISLSRLSLFSSLSTWFLIVI